MGFPPIPLPLFTRQGPHLLVMLLPLLLGHELRSEAAAKPELLLGVLAPARPSSGRWTSLGGGTAGDGGHPCNHDTHERSTIHDPPPIPAEACAEYTLVVDGAGIMPRGQLSKVAGLTNNRQRHTGAAAPQVGTKSSAVTALVPINGGLRHPSGAVHHSDGRVEGHDAIEACAVAVNLKQDRSLGDRDASGEEAPPLATALRSSAGSPR